MSLRWLDSHCHLDAPEFDLDRKAVMQNAQLKGVAWCVMPAVQAKDFLSLQNLAQEFHQPYALGIHPLYVPQAQEQDLDFLAQCIEGALAKDDQGLRSDARLVAVGEIGLDFFVPALCEPAMREKQEFFYHAQLKLAQKFKLPVILHVRKSADELLKGLRRHLVQGGIALGAHALQPFLTTGVISAMSMVGGTLILAIGIDLMGIKRLPVGNLMPAVIVAGVLGAFFM